MRKIAYHAGLLLLLAAVVSLVTLLVLTDEQGWGILAFGAALLGCVSAK